jgi:hypothetical protein
MLRELTSAELAEWMAFARLEPFGVMADDMRAGLAPAVYINAHKREGAEHVGPLDFFPWQEKTRAEPPVLSPEETAAQLRGMLNRLAKP